MTVNSEAMLAVDFGTTTTSAALVADGETVLIQEPSSGSSSWPSAVYLAGEELLVGTQAADRMQVLPLNFAAEFKRYLGQDAPVVLGERSIAPVDLATAMIAALRTEAERIHGGPVDRAVLTIPDGYGPADPRRELMIAAGEAAGFAAVELIPEPVAAALASPSGASFADGDVILVYDFGGGTFDAALVRVGDFQYEPAVLGHRSLDDCGGRDIDAAIYQWLCQNGPAPVRALLTQDNPDDESQVLEALRARLELATVANAMKHQLSEAQTAAKVFARVHELTMDRPALDQLAKPAIGKTVRCCQALLADASIPKENLRAVLLAGGSSKMPAVGDVLSAELGCPVLLTRNPETAVVLGAARFAGQARSRYASQSRDEPAERAVRWPIPGGVGVLLRWRVDVGSRYDADDTLAEVRLPSGSVIELRDMEGGILRAKHAEPGVVVSSGQWLLTARWPFRPWRRALQLNSQATPAGSGESVYIGSARGLAYGLVAATGVTRWQLPFGTAVSSGAAVADGAVYFGCADGLLRAVDAATGQPGRESKPCGAILSTPAASAGMVCFGADDQQVHALLTSNGEPFWTYPVGAQVRAPITIAGDTVYALATNNYLHALDMATGELRWKQPARCVPWVEKGTTYLAKSTSPLIAVDAADGSERWSASFTWATRPVFGEGTVYAADREGRLTAFDASTGDRRWAGPVTGAPLGIAIGDRLIYLGSSDQHLYALNPADGSLVWRYRAGGQVNSQPVVSDGAVYFTAADNCLYAVDALTGAGPSLTDE
jgi:molecular chaperone DnaK